MPSDISVQRGSITLGALQTSNTFTLPTPVSALGKAWESSASNMGLGGGPPYEISGSSDFIELEDYFSKIELTATGTVTVTRLTVNTPDHDLYHPFEIIECLAADGAPNSFVIRQRSEVYFPTSGVATSDGPNISGITSLAKCLVDRRGWVTKNEFYVGDRHLTTYEIIQSGADYFVRATRGDPANSQSGNEVSAYSVLEFGSAWTIQKIVHGYSSAGTEETRTISSVGSVNNAFILGAHRCGDVSSSDATSMVYLLNPTTLGLKLSPSAKAATSATDVIWIASNPNLRVRHYRGSIPASTILSSPLNVTISEVDSLGTTFTRFSTIIDQGGAAGAHAPLHVFAGELTSRTNFRMRRSYIRGASVSAGEYALSVIEMLDPSASNVEASATFNVEATMSAVGEAPDVYASATFDIAVDMQAVTSFQYASATFDAVTTMTANGLAAHVYASADFDIGASITATAGSAVLAAATFDAVTTMLAGSGNVVYASAEFAITTQMTAEVTHIVTASATFDVAASMSATGSLPAAPLPGIIETVIYRYPRETTVH